MRRSSIRNRAGSIASFSPKSGQSAAATQNNDNATTTAAATTMRRESLIKPTWQHITPGQIPLKTLDKINGINSDDSDECDEYPRRQSILSQHHLQQQQHHNNNNCNKIRETAASSSSSSMCSTSVDMRRNSNAQLLPSSRRASGVTMHNDGSNNEAATMSNDGSGITLCKNAGRALIRMISVQPTSCDEEEDYDVLGKVIMLGDSGVGKTCLLIRFRDGKYMPSYFITTVGLDFRNKVVVVDGTRVKLQIWDTAGQERFRSVTHAYYRDAHALLLLYDVTNKTTFDNIRAWLGEIREYAQDDVVIVLIGNKCDCGNSERQVKREDGERLAREHNVPFMETSAKTGLNVELAFAAVARQLKSRGHEMGDDGRFNVHDFVRDNTKARTICAQCKV